MNEKEYKAMILKDMLKIGWERNKAMEAIDLGVQAAAKSIEAIQNVAGSASSMDITMEATNISLQIVQHRIAGIKADLFALAQALSSSSNIGELMANARNLLGDDITDSVLRDLQEAGIDTAN